MLSSDECFLFTEVVLLNDRPRAQTHHLILSLFG